MHSVSVHLDPSQYLSGYRPEAGKLFLPTLSGARVGELVAARIAIQGQTIRATLFGRISSVRRVGRPALPPGVDLHLDQASLPAAGFLAMAARGEPVSFRERSPRYTAEQRIEAEHGGVALEVTTLNVSEGGCAVRWPGQLPLVGDEVTLVLARGIFGVKAKAVVCWNQPGGAVERSVGLRVVQEGRGARAWRNLVDRVAGSGARAA